MTHSNSGVINYFQCVGCGKRLAVLIQLEKCGHKICNECLEVKLMNSPVKWQDSMGYQSKVSTCPVCKEFFKMGGSKLF